MALGILMILYVTLSAVSIVGTFLLFLLKHERIKKKVFYFMAVWSMLIAVISATSFPSNYIGHQAAAWGIGFLGVASLFVFLKGKTKGLELAAHLMVAVSSIGGVLFLFL